MSRFLWGLGAMLLATSAFAQPIRAGGPPIRLLDAPDALRPVFAPDGAHVAFTRTGYAGLWVVSAGGDGLRQLTDAPAAGFGFAWSPDGTALAARTARYDGPRRLDAITVFRLDGTATALTDERADAPAVPRWAGAGHVALVDGATAEVLAAEPGARAVPSGQVALADAEAGLVLVDAATGAVRRLDPLGVRLLNVTPSPDGARLAFEAVGGNLFVMDADGSGLTDLGRGERPAWSPDGQWLAFQVTEDDGHAFTASEIVAARADGSARVALTATPDALEMNPSWSPDGRALAYDDRGALFLLPLAQ